MKGRRSAEGQGGGHGPGTRALPEEEGAGESPPGGVQRSPQEEAQHKAAVSRAGVGNHLLRLPGPTGSSAPSLS